MTKETDAIINVMAASGIEHVITDINTPKVHAATGNHYKKDCVPAPPQPPDAQHGKVGRAVDFAHRRYDGKKDTPELLRIWRFWADNYATSGKLNELFYAGPGAEFCIRGGVWMPWDAVPLPARIAIRNSHHDHVHVAVNKSVILEVSKPKPVEVPVSKEDDDMPKWADEYRWPNGDVVQVYPNGDIKCFGAKFSGSMNDLRDDAKTVFKPGGGNDASAVRPLVSTDSQAGYVIGLSSGHEFGMSFRPEHRKFYK